jgi:hypothetical protein
MALQLGPLSLQRLNQLADVPQILQEVEVLQGYRQFTDDPDNPAALPADERAKIDVAATEIMATLSTPLPTIAVIVRGHADQDLTKSGVTRTQFELDISRRRAKLVRRRLQAVLNAQALLLPLNLPESVAAALQLGLVRFRDEGRGATELLFPPRANPPLTERERSLNRRVEIFAAQDSQALRQLVMLCSHGGQLVPTNAVPLTSDVFPVVNCPFATSDGPSPCVTAKFFTDNVLVLLGSATIVPVGITFNSLGLPQGSIIVF